MGLTPPVYFEQLVKDAQDLMKKRQDILLELERHEQILNTASVGMKDPLIDASGFPRADIDVATIRTTRNQIHRLRNDAHQVTSEIEQLLVHIHQLKLKSAEPEDTDMTPPQAMTPEAMTPEGMTPEGMIPEGMTPFAIVNAVAPDSPAYLAGLRRQQKILQFGPIQSTNHDGLQALNMYVSQHENQPIKVYVLDQCHNRLELILTPRNGWGGRGTLGCHLLSL